MYNGRTESGFLISLVHLLTTHTTYNIHTYVQRYSLESMVKTSAAWSMHEFMNLLHVLNDALSIRMVTNQHLIHISLDI